jgi:sec-independent protein translocase protein TatB
MFDIGGLELLLITVVALLVIGPERLPDALRTLGLWLGRLRRSFTSVKAEIEKEIGMDEVRRQLHNEAVMDEMKRIEREVQRTVDDAKIDPNLMTADKAGQNEDSTLEDSNLDVEPVIPSDPTMPADTDITQVPGMQAVQAPEAPPPRTEAELEAAFESKKEQP